MPADEARAGGRRRGACRGCLDGVWLGCRYLGVCNDSVAIVQAGLGEAVTMFPCILAGRAKHKMSQLYQVRPLAHSMRSTQRGAVSGVRNTFGMPESCFNSLLPAL